ncbi:brachyurin-like [Chironomus tepperi]|uniref:brachyurin-like n=1 Tax=Chironomus tepperi TaxID=113505 RepID=UPI00391FC825
MEVKFIVLLALVSAVAADLYDPIDLSSIATVEERPGFWESRIPELRPRQIDPRSTSRIIGGWEVEPHSHPYAVFVLSSLGGSSWRCGGSIISPIAALTAAHCPEGTTSAMIIAGAHNINMVEPTQQRRTIPLADYRLHENYNPPSLQNDIAILLIRTNPVAETPEIRFPQLPYTLRNDLFAGEMVSIVGWGRTCATCNTSPVLRGVTNLIITNAECRQFYSTVVAHQMCMQTVGQRGTCPGDSGGPYTLPYPGAGNNLPFVQIAVHSFGASANVGGCDAQRPSGSVRTNFFLDWIDSTARL